MLIMKKTILLLLMLVFSCVLVVGCVSAPDGSASTTKKQSKLKLKPVIKKTSAKLDHRVNEYKTAGGLRYMVYVPSDYFTKKRKQYPMMLFLHGAEESGDDFGLVKMVGPVAEFETGRDLPFVLVVPQIGIHKTWKSRELFEVLDEVEANYRVNISQEYLTGISMGGNMVWVMAGKQPERFAAVAPVSAYAMVEQSLKVRDVPVWAFHGKYDDFVSVDDARAIIKAVNNVGGTARLTVFKDQSHKIWDKIYSKDDLYRWCLMFPQKPSK